MMTSRLHTCKSCSKPISRSTSRAAGMLARVCIPCFGRRVTAQRVEEGRRQYLEIAAYPRGPVAEAIRTEWPEADALSIREVLECATRDARPLLGHRTAEGHETFDCPCANPYHHLSNGDLLAAGHEPTKVTVWGDPDPERVMANAVGIARVAAKRHEENLDAQADGTADALGIKRPVAWNARYDGDF